MSVRSFKSVNPGRARMAASVLAGVAALAAMALPAPAMADRGHHRGHGYGYGHGGGQHWHGGARLNVYVPAPAYRPHYYAPPRVHYAPPPAYYAPRVVYSAPLAYVPPVVHSSRSYAPPVYIERNDLASTAPAPVADTAFWYFCADSNTYYPYVTQCATPWERVVPTPPSAGR